MKKFIVSVSCNDGEYTSRTTINCVYLSMIAYDTVLVEGVVEVKFDEYIISIEEG